MKRTRILLMAFAALLSMGLISCDKENNNNSSGNGGNNGGDNPSGGVNTNSEWVDLGLPSGLLWATCNLGANAPEEYGNYYAWGEISPKESYKWSTYKYCTVGSVGRENWDHTLKTLTKYNTLTLYGTPDNKTVLEAMDDAATSVLGSGARTPTKADWEELIANTTIEWTTMNGVSGRKFTAANGNTIFLPAAGHHWHGTGLNSAGYLGIYWSSSLRTDYPPNAMVFLFTSSEQRVDDYNRRDGNSIRAVRQK